MARDKGNKGDQTGSGDKRKAASREARGTGKGAGKDAQSGGQGGNRDEDWRKLTGRGPSRVEVQVNVPGAEERARKGDAQQARDEVPKGPKGGD